jgi:thiol-disulfide isomerase/thioredoxin
MIGRKTSWVGFALSGLILAGFSGLVRADDAKPKDSVKIELSELQRYYDSILPDLAEGRRPEAADELMSLLFSTPSQPVPTWYGPAHSRYDWAWVSSRFDSNRDGKVFRKELAVPDTTWKLLDRDGDGVVTIEDQDWENSAWARQEAEAQRKFRTLDADNDGRLTAAEWAESFTRAAGTEDGLSFDEFRRNLLPAQSQSQTQNGDRRTMTMTPKRRADYIKAVLTEDVGTFNEGPQVGETAPDFSLNTHDGKARISLSSFRGSRPVVLTFGSYTCPPYRQRVPGIDKLHDCYGEKVEFLGVYVREAHPTDGWVLESNTKANIEVPQPTNREKRLAVAQTFCDSLKPRYPLLVDEMDDRVARLYSGTPNRLYIIDRDGKVVYKSGRGPRGYKTDQLEQTLVLFLLDQETTGPRVAAGVGAK